MNKTTVVHCKHKPYDVYIGRPSKWGNPFSNGTREENIAKYKKWLRTDGPIDDIHELKGKILGCWCAPKACHGDVLARLADALED